MNRVDIRLCAMLDARLCTAEDAARTARDLREAGCTALILRPALSFRASAAVATAIAAATPMPVLIEERVDLALVCAAAGVLLRQSDMPPREARATLGPASIVGLAIGSVTEADELFRLPVDCAFLGLAEAETSAPGLDLELIGRLAFRAHLAAPGIAVAAAAPAGSPPAHLVGAGADGIVCAAASLGPARGAAHGSPRAEIDSALAARGRP